MKQSYFFCGIGGSGMLPLALIVKGRGAKISGSDRSRDQGLLPEKFSWLEAQGIDLFPQNGSGLTAHTGALVISTAIEETIPDIRAAKERGIPLIHRSDLLAELFNGAKTRIAIAGTSGKTTTTGMIGYLLKESGFDPSVMNGGIFRNYAGDNPYCSALVGVGDIFVTEADESDGSIAKYNPTIAVLNNIALDHKPLEELIPLFTAYLNKADQCVLNYDSEAVRALAKDIAPEKIISYALDHPADIGGKGLSLQVPGRYNQSNALAALGVAQALGIDLIQAREILSGFKGIRRRMETIGTKNGVTVIDDFAHNPDKIAASISALKEKPGRLIVFFQPHGFGPLKMLGNELAKTFSDLLTGDDVLMMVDAYYAGGTADRSVGAKEVLEKVRGVPTRFCADRAMVKKEMAATAKKGDRIIIMGARDDTLSSLAQEILQLF